MRSGFLRLILLIASGGFAGVCVAQWQHFGQTSGGRAAKSASLAEEFVTAHNAVRAKVGTPPLTWSDSLAAVAQEWANHLMSSGQLAHSHNPKYGENLYEITGAPATPAMVIDAWAGEAKDYSYSSNSCRGVCGHYTQVVWNDTKEVGCALAHSGNREIWVCEYSPPGNWIGRKPY